eukprot:COSAG02_NODE_65610_length_257_cov_1.297468_1_plen_33_part_10
MLNDNPNLDAEAREELRFAAMAAINGSADKIPI